MRAIIPVAGLGTRLKPHTHSLPKVLLNVAGKPILGHILDKLESENIKKATFIIGYLGEKVKEYVAEHYPEIDAMYAEQKEMLGLGHAIHCAIPTFDGEELFIILGDTIFDVDLKVVFAQQNTSLGVKLVQDPSRFGVALLEDNRVVKLIEKPSELVSRLALVGLYYIKNTDLLKQCLNDVIHKEIKTRGEFQLTDALQLMLDRGEEITTFPVDGWYDCGKPETLIETNRFLLSLRQNHISIEGVVLNPPVFIADSAKVSNSIIGPNATIAESCVISDSSIRNSIISSGSKIDKVMLENSIIGSKTVIKGNYKKLNAGDSSEIELY